MEHDAWLALGDDEETQQKYQYFMRTDPDQRDFLGPKEQEWDPLTNTTVTFRQARVGMVRGAKEDNMRPVKVYLGFDGKPSLPHIRIEAAQQLRGWYQSAQETRPGSRVRPCYTEAVLTEPYGGFCTVGCAFSLCAGETIDTPNGPRPIEAIKAGEFVWGRLDRGVALAQVKASTRHWKVEGYVVLTLEDGRELRLTADHPVYSATRRAWVAAGSLEKGEALEQIRFGGDGAPGAHRSRQAEDARAGSRQRGTLSRNGEKSASAYQGATGASHPNYEGAGLRSEGDGTPRPDWTREECGETLTLERAPEVRGDQGSHAGYGAGSPRGDGTPRQWPQDAGMEDGSGRARKGRGLWLSHVEAQRLHGHQGPRPSDEVRVGGAACRLDGRPAHELGVRALEPEAAERLSIHSGLPAIRRPVPGGEGVRGPWQHEQGGFSPSSGASDYLAQQEGLGEAGCPTVEQITRVAIPLYVHDIETTTGNFYQRGVLVHNCYINSGFRGYRGSGLITVPVNYGDQIRQQLTKHLSSAAGYFSSFTDPFLPIEAQYHNTQRGAEEFTRLGLPVFFLSRLAYPGWAFDILQQNKYSYAQKSINTDNEQDWRKLSPGAATLEQHFEDIRELRRRGVYVSIQVNPIIAGVTSHEDIEHLFELLAEAGVNHVITKFVEANHPWAPAMVERITKRFGDNRAAAFRDLFTENSCGGQKTIAEEYRREGFERYRRKATALGMSYALCYEYSKEGGTWHSIGGEYKTSDQCHGHRVPMFTRNRAFSDSGKPIMFREVAECPPSGCLTCASDNGGAPRCGNEERGKAKAMRSADYRLPVR